MAGYGRRSGVPDGVTQLGSGVNVCSTAGVVVAADAGWAMAVKLVHRVREQEVRSPNEPTARRYADRFGGGPGRWTLTPTGAGGADRAPASASATGWRSR